MAPLTEPAPSESKAHLMDSGFYVLGGGRPGANFRLATDREGIPFVSKTPHVFRDPARGGHVYRVSHQSRLANMIRLEIVETRPEVMLAGLEAPASLVLGGTDAISVIAAVDVRRFTDSSRFRISAL